MRFRLYRMTRGGRYSLCHFGATVVAMFVALNGVHWYTQIPWLVLTFPLGSLMMLAPWLGVDTDRLAAHITRGGLMLLAFGVVATNSFLWGYTAAHIRRRIFRARARKRMGHRAPS